MKRQATVILWLGVVSVAACSSSHTEEVMSDEEVVSLCDALIAEFESSCTEDQLDALEAIELEVQGLSPTALSLRRIPAGTYTLEPTSGSELYRMYGIRALMEGKLGPALWASAQGLRIVPRDPQALAQLAVLLMEKDRCHDANRLLAKARHEDTHGDALIRVSLASSALCLGNEEAAGEALVEAASLEPDSAAVERAERQFYLRVLGNTLSPRVTYSDVCANDVVQAIHLGSLNEINTFVIQKNSEAQQLTMETLSLMYQMPYDLPTSFVEEMSLLDDTYKQTVESKYDRPAEDATRLIMDTWSTRTAELAEEEGDCCASVGGACCPCIQANCTGNMNLVESEIMPASFGALMEYLPGRIRLLERYETDIQRLLYRMKREASERTVQWAAQYAYGLLAANCKEVAIQIASIIQPPYAANEYTQAACTLPDECWSAEYEAQLAEQRHRAEEERIRRAEEEQRRALAAQQAQDLLLNVNLCLDGLGCLSIEGSQVSFAFGGTFAFAQFSVDVESYDVGIRTGIGLNDPTGNAWGVDLSMGVTIGTSGANFDLTCSESALLGTRRKGVTLFKLGQSW